MRWNKRSRTRRRNSTSRRSLVEARLRVRRDEATDALKVRASRRLVSALVPRFLSASTVCSAHAASVTGVGPGKWALAARASVCCNTEEKNHQDEGGGACWEMA